MIGYPETGGFFELDTLTILELSLYFLALLNPASKILFLATYDPPLNRKQAFELSWKSSCAAFAMLAIFAVVGKVLLEQVFRVDLYALQITGGLIVFAIGWNAAREGRFFQKREHEMREDFNSISIVPLAAPLIAGPATITMAISFSAQYGILFSLGIVAAALAMNFIMMLFAMPLNKIFCALHLTGPLIRITGLLVAAVAMQMILTGLSVWIHSLK